MWPLYDIIQMDDRRRQSRGAMNGLLWFRSWILRCPPFRSSRATPFVDILGVSVVKLSMRRQACSPCVADDALDNPLQENTFLKSGRTIVHFQMEAQRDI
jgi:hypothetical protein